MKIMFSIPFKTFNTNKITIMSNYLDYKMSNKLFLKIKMKEEIHKSKILIILMFKTKSFSLKKLKNY